MDVSRFSIVIALFLSTSNACLYYVCRQTYHPWAPQLAPNQCGWQVAKPIANVRVYSSTPPCPPNVDCRNQAKVRGACNCREVQHCRWAAWGSWTGAVPDGSCNVQRRTRLAQATYSYRVVAGSCSSVVSSCPKNDETEQRTHCRCRKVTGCVLSPWTSWTGNVPNGQCARQTSTQPVTPHYEYIERADNCNAIRSSCDPPVVNSRIYCLCETKDCKLQQWSRWSVISGDPNSCPNEERTRDYNSATRYIPAIKDCNNVGIRSCPNKEREERQKDVKCGQLTLPAYGRLLDSACDGVSSSCHSICRFKCNYGFELSDRRGLRCLGNGQWDNAPPVCKDILKPEIRCPNTTSYPNEPGKNYKTIQVPSATAFDLVGVVSINSNYAGKLKLVVGHPVTVRYTASDLAGNENSCTTVLQAIDNEPPKVISCPQNIEKTATSKTQVIWTEPVFDDNVEGLGVDRESSLKNGQQFGEGEHNVRYTAADKAGNKAVCEFKIIIRKPDSLCPPYKKPKNGSLVCNNMRVGIKNAYVCGISCERGFGFAKLATSKKVHNYYLCMDDGKWYGADASPPTPIPLPSGRPWSDCSETYPADAILKHFTIMAGPCNMQKTKEQLKKEFEEKLRSNALIKFLFCMNSQCDVTDIQVSCASSKKRSVGTLKVEFDMITQSNHPPLPPVPAGRTFSSVQDLRRIEEMLRKQIEATIKRLQELLSQLEAQIKRVLAQLLRINEILLQIISQPFQIGCPYGSSMSMVGNPPMKICTKCPIGKMYDTHSKTCKECPIGNFQNFEGKAYCTACPSGTTTLGVGASNVHHCKDICGPGTYSRDGHGLSTCMACRKGFYQPNSRRPSCIACPNGKTTAGYGSVSSKNCI